MLKKSPLLPSLSPLALEIAAFLRHRGFVLHSCCCSSERGEVENAVGGVCVTEEPGGAVLVGWSPHSTLVHNAGVTERAEVIADMVAVFRGWLQRAHYPVEPGPLGRSVRVLSPVSADTVPDHWVSI